MPNVLLQADAVLRGRSGTAQQQAGAQPLLLLIGLIFLFGPLYGAVMGSYGGLADGRLLQVVYSAAKVPFLLLVTFGISLPSFFVLNTLLGVRADWGYVLRALLTTQAALTMVLASLAPMTVLWYVSWANYSAAILFNGMMFGIASISAQLVLWGYYRPLIQGNRAHRRLFLIWVVIYAFVGIQMGWVLRPFIGHPDAPTQFFRPGAWGNAYVEVAQIFWRLVSGAGA